MWVTTEHTRVGFSPNQGVERVRGFADQTRDPLAALGSNSLTVSYRLALALSSSEIHAYRLGFHLHRLILSTFRLTGAVKYIIPFHCGNWGGYFTVLV